MAQIKAVTRRRRLPQSAVPGILAESKYLSDFYAQREAADIAQERLDIEREGFEEEKDTSKKATKIAAATLGVQAAMLYPQYKSAKGGRIGEDAGGSVSSDTGGGVRYRTWNALREPGTYLGGLAGGATGAAAAGAFTEDRKYKIAGGALGGALGGYYGGGEDPYSAAIGAVFGGVIGGFL
jgi:hypothetical protein